MRVTIDLSGSIAAADAMRLALVYGGFALAMLMGKVAVLAARRHDWERTAECTSFAAAILTPALFLIGNFGEPLKTLTSVYALALAAGVVWVAYRVRFHRRWRRLRHGVTTATGLPLHRR